MLLVLGAPIVCAGIGPDTIVPTMEGRVHNIGLMREQEMRLFLGFFVAGAGLVCVVGGQVVRAISGRR
jgi:hypothetical protein